MYCYLLQNTKWEHVLFALKWDCDLLASKTTTLKLGHVFSSRRQHTRAFTNLCNEVEYRQGSFYARDTFPKNIVQIEHKIPT
jgi:hypothetical protein